MPAGRGPDAPTGPNAGAAAFGTVTSGGTDYLVVQGTPNQATLPCVAYYSVDTIHVLAALQRANGALPMFGADGTLVVPSCVDTSGRRLQEEGTGLVN